MFHGFTFNRDNSKNLKTSFKRSRYKTCSLAESKISNKDVSSQNC